MEQFRLLEGDRTLKASREQINDALLTVRSLSSGTTFPTTDLSDGMLCYRTDHGRLYQLADAANNIWTDRIAMSIAGTANTADTIAWANIVGKPTAYPAEEHSHTYAGSLTEGGSATKAEALATPRTINGIPFDGTADITITNTIAQGGTGANNTADARANLGLSTAITGASISGKVITLTFADGTTKTLTTQDTNTSNWSLSNATKGYTRDNSTGFTIQWNYATDSVQTWTFSKAFTKVYYAGISTVATGNSNSGLDYVNTVTTTSMKTVGWDGKPQYMIAIGKS